MRILTGLVVAAVVATAGVAVAGAAGAAAPAPAPAATATAAAGGTAYTWSAGGDGESWSDALNWSPNGVPGDGDGASVQAPSDTVCHAHVTGVPTDLELTDLTIDELPYQGDPDSPCLTSISGGSITITHLLTFHAGTIDTAITIASGASALVTPGVAHDATQFSQAVTDEGAMTLADNTGVEFLSLTDGPGITVASGATLTTRGSNRLYADCCNSPAHVTNNGTIQLGAGTTTLDSVELDQNALLNATGGATILTDFAPQTAGSGARWTGNGSWQLGYSSHTTVSGTQTLAQGFTWRFGGNGSTAQEYLAGTFGLAGAGRFVWGGGQIGAAMTVGPTIAFTADGPDGTDTRFLAGATTGGQHVALTNRGTMTFSGGAGWYGVSGAQLTNAATGVLTLGAGTAVGADCCTNPASIVNSGRLFIPAGSGTVTVDETGYRATGGTLDVGTGSDLELTGGAPGSLSTTTISGGGTVGIAQPVTLTGTETVATGTTVTLERSGSFTSTGTATATVGGPGSFVWTGGSVVGAVTLSTAAGQTVSGTADAKRIHDNASGRHSTVTFGGPTTILPGTAHSPDTVQSDPGSRVQFTGALSLRANTKISGGAVTTSGATTVAAGTGQAYFTGNATLANTGALTVKSGTLASDETLVQTGGTTTIAAGAAVEIVGSSSVLRVSGGTLAGSGQVAGNVALGAATLAPGGSGTGTLTVTGTFTATTGATLQFDLASGARDVLAVGGSATLHGTLRLVDLANYQPVTGETATVVTAGQLIATFGCTATTGAGAQTQYWTAKVAVGTQLQLTSRVGTSASC